METKARHSSATFSICRHARPIKMADWKCATPPAGFHIFAGEKREKRGRDLWVPVDDVSLSAEWRSGARAAERNSVQSARSQTAALSSDE